MAHVKYVGPATIRQITRAEWEQAGVKDQETVVWNSRNGWTVPDTQFSDEAWQHIEADQNLIVISNDDAEQSIKDSNAEARAMEDAQKEAAAAVDREPPTGPTTASTTRSGRSRGATGVAGGSTGSKGGATGSAGGSTATT